MIHDIVNSVETPPMKVVLSIDNMVPYNRSSRAALAKPRNAQTLSTNI